MCEWKKSFHSLDLLISTNSLLPLAEEYREQRWIEKLSQFIFFLFQGMKSSCREKALNTYKHISASWFAYFVKVHKQIWLCIDLFWSDRSSLSSCKTIQRCKQRRCQPSQRCKWCHGQKKSGPQKFHTNVLWTFGKGCFVCERSADSSVIKAMNITTDIVIKRNWYERITTKTLRSFKESK